MGASTVRSLVGGVDAALGDFQDPGECHVAEGERAGAADGARHVGDAVVDHLVDDVGWAAVGGGPAGGDAAALVDGDVDDHAAGLHPPQVLLFDEHRGLRAGDQHRADHEVGPRELLADRVAVAEQAVDVGRHDVVEVAESVHVDVENGHVGAKAGGDLGRVRADDSAAEDRDVGRCDARHAAQQNAASHLRPLEIFRPLLDAHPPSDFTHRRQERQPAAIVGERLVGNAGGAAFEHRLGQLAIGGEVEVREECLPFANERPLGRQRFFHFDDQVGPGEDFLGAMKQLASLLEVVLIGNARPKSGTGFHQHLMPPANELLDADRQHGHAVFVQLDLFRHTDDHDFGPCKLLKAWLDCARRERNVFQFQV